MGRAPCCENKAGLKKGAWTAEEDEKLVAFIHKNNGHGSWRTLPQLAGLQRCGKSCRLRWTNYLRPNIKRGNFTPEEEWTITQLHAVLGNKWSTIASRLPGRTDNEVKNHWNTHLKKQLSRLGIDPVTHRPASVSSLVTFNNVNVKDDNMVKYSRQKSSFDCKHRTHTTALPRVSVLDRSYVSHMAQWELARLEAEARQMSGKACASSTSSDGMKYTAGVAAASIAGKSQAYSCSRGQGQGQGQENEMLELILGELLQDAPIAGGSLPSLDTSNSSSSAGSQLMNEVDITSDLTSFISIMRSPSPSSPNCTAAHDALLPLIPASPLPAPSEATSHITYWANMLSLVGPVISSCPA